jgi:hypothetical protein
MGMTRGFPWLVALLTRRGSVLVIMTGGEWGVTGLRIPKELIGREVVLDAQGQFVYIGRLVGGNEFFIEMADVDVHDSSESNAPKEVYVMDARKYGIKKNRTSVYVLTSQAVSISPLGDVIEY